MRTLADFKRALTLGSKWEAYNHYYKASLGVREVSKVQSNSFAFKRVSDNGESVNSWCDFPKAKDIKFREDGTVEIYSEWCGGYQLLLSYKAVQ